MPGPPGSRLNPPNQHGEETVGLPRAVGDGRGMPGGVLSGSRAAVTGGGSESCHKAPGVGEGHSLPPGPQWERWEHLGTHGRHSRASRTDTDIEDL